MDRARVKNFIILLLLIVNIIFLVLWVIDSHESILSMSGMEENVCLMLADCGVTVSDSVELLQDSLSSVVYYRDMNIEAERVESILGECAVEDRGGNIYFYNGTNGQARFRGTGEFELLLNSGALPVKGSYVSACADIIKKLGMTADMNMDAQYADDGSVTVIAMCRVDGVRVYNCRASFTFSASELRWVQGMRIFDASSAESSTDGMDSATAISYFAQFVSNEEIEAASLSELECGYIHTVTVSGECILTPTWRFSTDTGEYYINALTGKIQTM